MEEPSVLDYLKAKLTPWKKSSLVIPPASELETPSKPAVVVVEESAEESDIEGAVAEEPSEASAPRRALHFPWRALLALLLAMIAQVSLNPGPDRNWQPGLILYLASAALVVWGFVAGEWQLAPFPSAEKREEAFTLQPVLFLLGLIFAAFTFATSGGNRFSIASLLFLSASIAFFLAAFWRVKQPGEKKERVAGASLASRLSEPPVAAWILLFLAVFALAVLFRMHHLASIPAEPTSDHAEKILDVTRVLSGQTNIFFPNNGGREALHFYWIALLHKLTGIELTFYLLKLSTALIGLFALPFLYLLGVEIANRRVGLLAVTFAAVAYWPGIISRVGLRFPFYVLFTAALLYFLLRGIRTQTRLPFIAAGITLGLSLYGYSADRLLPLVALAALGLYLIHPQSRGSRRQTIWLSLLMIIFAGVVALPLLRYILDDPSSFLFRTLTRISSLEQPLPGPAWQIFLDNLRRALVMFFWEDGEVWLASIPGRPALEVVTAALFWIGAVLSLVRYVSKRHWLDLFLLLSIPLLMLPSVLALAFPAENPNLYRTGGAIVPVFLLIGLAADAWMTSLQAGWSSETSGATNGRRAAWASIILLVALTAFQSYNLIFDQYSRQYRLSVWNTSEMGRLMRTFADLTGTTDNAWVIPYPYWVDTRLVGMNAGFLLKDYALPLDQLESTSKVNGSKLFLVKPEDQAAVQALQQMYPHGWLQIYDSQVDTKEFLVFLVPPEGTQGTP